MSADNLKIIGNAMGVWKKNMATNKSAGVNKTPNTNRGKAARMDTFEISGYDASNVQEQTAISKAIKDEKANIIKELSNSHIDANKFLEIKAQVRAGEYNLNSKEIANSVLPYVDFD